MRNSIFCNSLLIFTLAACGGGSGNSNNAQPDDSLPDSQTPSDTSISGLVIDGYIQGATVCLDINNNYACDDSEPSALSGPGGAYSFTYSGSIEPGTQILANIPIGAVDEDLGPIPKSYNMLAPADYPEVVTPLTTLVSQEVLSSGKALTPEQAEKSVKLALGIDLDKDLLTNNFIENNDSDLSESASVIAEAIAITLETIGNDSEAGDLSQGQLIKAAIRTVKDDVAVDLISNGAPTLSLDQVGNSVGQLISGQVQNIVAATRSGDGKRVNLVKEIKEGNLIILSEGVSSIIEDEEEVWREGMQMEFVYYPDAVEDQIVNITSDDSSKVAMLVYEGSNANTWVPVLLDEDYVLDINGEWVLPSSLDSSGAKLKDNCAIFYDNGVEASQEFCFVRKDIQGMRLGDLLPDICIDDDGLAIPGCDPDVEIPEDSFVYDVTMTVPENDYGGVYSVWFEETWPGYVDDNVDQTIQEFIDQYMQVIGFRGDLCNTAFRIESYDAENKSGFFEWTDASGSNCGDFDWAEEVAIETLPFEVIQVGDGELIKALTPLVYRANNPGDRSAFLTFSKVLNGQGQYGIYGGDFRPSGTKISLPFNGNLSYGVFASRIFVDFVFTQVDIPPFPYDDYLAN